MQVLRGILLFAVYVGVASAEPALSASGEAELPAIEIDQRPVISVIIDDLGARKERGMEAVQLPGPVACAFLPHYPYTVILARRAHSYNKEVLLHLPMQSVGDDPLGPGGLRLEMTENEFVQELQKDLESVPHVQGINNHMGSLLTRHPGHMLWLMQQMNLNGNLFFVDSRTTNSTVAHKVANEMGVPNMERDVFLDNDRDEESINHQFDKVIETARRKGTALAIGHPYESTLKVLAQRLPELQAEGIRMVSVAEMIKLRQVRRETWHASLSHSPRVVKNSRQLLSSTCCAVPESR